MLPLKFRLLSWLTVNVNYFFNWALSTAMCYFSYSGFYMTMSMQSHASTFLPTAQYSSQDQSINQFTFTTCNLASAFASLSVLMMNGMQSSIMTIICLVIHGLLFWNTLLDKYCCVGFHLVQPRHTWHPLCR